MFAASSSSPSSLFEFCDVIFASDSYDFDLSETISSFSSVFELTLF
jgi:hypothetical protein